ncbi:MAG: septum site-determining protein Ssd [Actinomycetales bacterium]
MGGTTTAAVAVRGGEQGSVGRAAVRRLGELGGLRVGDDPRGASLVLDDLGGGHLVVAAGPELGAQLHVPRDEERLLDLMLTAVPARARRIGVVGAHGGAGATMLAIALALVPVKAGLTTTLVDLDPAGGVAGLVAGLERDPGTRWADLGRQEGTLLPERLTTSLPAFEHVRLLGGDLRGGADVTDPVVPRAVRAVAQASEVVVLDLPRSVLTAGAPLVTELDHVVLVACAGLRGGAAAASAARALTAAGPEVSLVVRRRPGEDVLASDVAEATGLPLLAVVRHLRTLDAGVEHGLVPGGRRGVLRAAAEEVADAVGILAGSER